MTHEQIRAKYPTPEAFVLALVVANKANKGYKSTHTVYSGLNSTLREVYNADPVKVVTEMTKAGKVASWPTKGGASVCLPQDKAQNSAGSGVNKALSILDGSEPAKAGRIVQKL